MGTVFHQSFTSRVYHYSCFFLLVLALNSGGLQGQDTIRLANPSFEDQAQHSHVPQEWINCGFVYHSPPDTGPSAEFRSTTRPADGQSFLVLVSRDNGTWERIGGTLDRPLRPGQAYALKVQLAKSDTYFSESPVIRKTVNFAFPLRLRIWGAKVACEARELLAQSPPVDHSDWRSYTLTFEPMLAYSWLIFEAYYEDDTALPYPGNLCVDDVSPLVPLDTSPTDLRERRMVSPPFVQLQPADSFPPRTVEQERLRELLARIQPGQIDQGLYDLAIYQRTYRQAPWIICVRQDGSKAARKFKRQLKRQIAAMNLEGQLRVDDYVSVFQTMQWLCTPADGALGLKVQ
jgi:hypothetical protein